MFFLVSVSRHRRRAPTVIRASTELRFELGWRQIAKAGVRAHVVVVPSPLLDPHLRVHAVPKPLQAQILVAELPVERFVGRILPRLPRLDERGFDLRLERRMFPHRVYKGSVGNRKRYFALKLPIAVDSETATFAYVDPGNETDGGFRSWGITHGRLWGALREKGIRVRVVAIATEYQPLIRFEGLLRAWASRASRKQGGKMTVKEEIELLNKAIVDGDDDVLASHGGSTAALRYCVELEELPAAKVGDGVKIDDYTTFRASRFAGLENGNQGGAERGREKA